MKIELNGFMGLLFIVFLILKLIHIIAWSWWWVTAPVWIPITINFILLFFLQFYNDKRI
jgi:hypothetical protein